MARRIRTLVALTALAVPAAVVGVAAPAQAAFTCSGGYFCVWTGYQGTGTKCYWSGAYIRNQGGLSLTGTSCNNNTKSWYNASSQSIIMYDANYCNPASASSWRRTMTPGRVASGEGSDWNNRVSSLQDENDPSPDTPC